MAIKYKLKTKPIQMRLNFDKVSFPGETYDPKYDKERLTGQQLRVFKCMKDGKWRTYKEIQDWNLKHFNKYDSEVSISTRLRHFRMFEFGDHELLRRSKGSRYKGLNEYKLVVNNNWTYYKLTKGEI